MGEKINEAFCGVVQFNSTIGNLDSVDVSKLLAQSKVVVEEANELAAAIRENECQEQVLKEMCDVLVVAFGMLAMLQRQGYRVLDCMNDVVNPNNMTKVLDNATDAHYTSMAYNATADNGAFVKQLSYNQWGVFNQHGKLLKPIGYQKVKASELIHYCPQKEE